MDFTQRELAQWDMSVTIEIMDITLSREISNDNEEVIELTEVA